MVRLVQPWPYQCLREKNGIPTDACVIEWPLRAVCHSLRRLRGIFCTFSSFQASKVAARELRLLNFLVILEREASAQIGEGLTCTLCVEVISGS